MADRVTVAFVHVGNDRALPRAMVASVHRAMPDARVLHLADETTERVAGADEIVRLPYDGVRLMTFRLRHFSNLEARHAVFLDTDVIVQEDLSALFAEPFDVALTRRDEAVPDPNGHDVAALMPYNTGVMVSRPEGWDFWRNALAYCERLPQEHQKWWGDQLAVQALAAVCPLTLRELPCSIYNYTPASQTEDVSTRHVVHYKGTRKAWMLSRARAEFGLSD